MKCDVRARASQVLIDDAQVWAAMQRGQQKLDRALSVWGKPQWISPPDRVHPERRNDRSLPVVQIRPAGEARYHVDVRTSGRPFRRCAVPVDDEGSGLERSGVKAFSVDRSPGRIGLNRPVNALIWRVAHRGVKLYERAYQRRGVRRHDCDRDRGNINYTFENFAEEVLR